MAANGSLNIGSITGADTEDWVDLRILERSTFDGATVSVGVVHRAVNCLVHTQVLQSGPSDSAH